MELVVIFTEGHKTRDMFDPLAREEILHEVPVYRVARHYSESKGAPTKELYAMSGIMLLQQVRDLADEETVEFVRTMRKLLSVSAI